VTASLRAVFSRAPDFAWLTFASLMLIFLTVAVAQAATVKIFLASSFLRLLSTPRGLDLA
jgi:hypothetical protein